MKAQEILQDRAKPPSLGLSQWSDSTFMRLPALNIPIKIAICLGIVALLLSRMDFSAIGAQLAQVQVGGIISGAACSSCCKSGC